MFKRYLNTLFGRLFTGFCLIILMTAAGVWMVAYTAQLQRNTELGIIEWRFVARKSVDCALGIYDFGGREALIHWLNNAELNNSPSVYLVNKDGVEFSGRQVPQKAIETLKAIRQHPSAHETGYPADAYVKNIELEGENWDIFAVRTTPFPVRLIPHNIYHFPVGIAILIAGFLTLFVSWALARLYTRSLNQLDSAMRQFADGNLDTRSPQELSSTNTEVSSLAKVFDDMADRIQTLITRQRRLFHDVSHEIRSPLARISVAIELAKREPSRTTSTFDRIQKEINNIDDLLESILTYARLENDIATPKSAVGLADIVESVAEDLRFEGESRSVTVNLHIEGDPIINADGRFLARAFDNIARNALRHSPNGAVIYLSLTEDEQSFIFTCRDEGDGLPEKELPYIFAPFVRGNHEATGTGYGLGLAIARRSIQNHEGSIEAHNIQPHGLEILVRLPKSLAISMT